MTVLRSTLAASLLLAFSLPAQGETNQDPEKGGQTTKEQLDQLQKEKARLEAEIRYAKERSGDAKGLLRSKLGGRPQELRSIDAGTALSARPVAKAPVQRRVARIATADEMQRHPEGTMLVVEGNPIGQATFDRVMTYLRENGAGDDAVKAQRALFDLIRIEAVAAAFYERESEARFGEVLGEVQQGTSVAEVAAKTGSVPGADAEGRVEVTRNSYLGAFFEMTVFGTEPGHDAMPFRTAGGYVIVHVDSIEKGATPQLDKAICHVAQISYGEQAEVAAAQSKVNSGQVDVMVRDQGVFDMLPALFKPTVAPTPPSPAETRQRLMTQIEEMKKYIEKMEANGDQQNADGLRQKLQMLQQELANLPQEDVAEQTDKQEDGK